VTSDVQRTVRARVDGGIIRLRLLWTVIEPLEVQRPGRTGHDHLSDPIHRCRINQDPWPGLRLEDFGQPAIAAAGVDAQFRLPKDSDLVITVNPLYTRPLALFVLVIGFVCH
jgi:hypothetical protein